MSQSNLQDFSALQQKFLQQAFAVLALKFGEFTLKSGRISPYFFNAGAFSDGQSLAILANCYAAKAREIIEAEQIDCLFGPAYKGIPFVTATASALFNNYAVNIPWAFDRKEAKDHGEGGRLVGADIRGKRILLIDDVLTAGTAVRNSIKLLKEAGAEPKALLVALDRKEWAVENSQKTALTTLAEEQNIFTAALLDLDDLLNFAAENRALTEYLEKLQNYRRKYAVTVAK